MHEAVKKAVGPAVQAAMKEVLPATLEMQLKPIHKKLQHIEGALKNGLFNADRSLLNSKALCLDSRIFPKRNSDGELPPNFPITRKDLEILTADSLMDLLQFYSLPQGEGPSIELLHSVKAHLGIV